MGCSMHWYAGLMVMGCLGNDLISTHKSLLARKEMKLVYENGSLPSPGLTCEGDSGC